MISCLKLSLAKAGTSGWLSGRLGRQVSARYSSMARLLILLQWYHIPTPYLTSSSRFDSRRCEEVQSANLSVSSVSQFRAFDYSSTDIIILSPDPCSLYSCRRVRRLGDILPLREPGAVGVEGNGGSRLVHGQEVFDLTKSALGHRIAVCHGQCDLE